MNQVKFFKLGCAFGNRVMSTNSAVQGCSLSILMVNSLYSVLSDVVSHNTTQVSLSSFIDDCKVWGSARFESQLVETFKIIQGFDETVGQVINPTKSKVLTRKQKRAKHFLLKVNQPFRATKQVKSLGYFHSADARKSAKNQDARVDKAVKVAKKVACLPTSSWNKGFHVHANVHSKWLYGTDTQAPSKRALQKLRTAIVNVFVVKKHKLRCPFMFFLSHHDPFLDPFSKWTLHVFLKLRKLSQTNPHIVKKILHKAKAQERSPCRTKNGISNVVAFLCHELQWTIGDPDAFRFSRSDDADLVLNAGSNDFFKESIGLSARVYLFRSSPDRHDNPLGARRGVPDIFLTRFLSDHCFSSDGDWEFIKPYLDSLPRSHDYTRSILKTLFSGSVFTGPRLQAAKISQTDICQACGERETHKHLFCECDAFASHRPTLGNEPLLSWTTGIMVESEGLSRFRKNCSPDLSLPDIAVKASSSEPIFVDGSCYYQKWKPLRSAASAVVIPAQRTSAFPLPGQDCTSQRAEIYAAILAVHMTTGPISVGTDCATVLSRIQVLQAHSYDKTAACKFDNADLWCLFCDVSLGHEGEVRFFKVKAHVAKGDSRQPVSWTERNSEADAAAKQVARERLLTQLSMFKADIARAVCIQTHLVRTMVSRAQTSLLAPLDGFEPLDGVPKGLTLSSKMQCLCKPTFRLRTKAPRVCSGYCRGCSVRVGEVEDLFVSLCLNAMPIPGSVTQTLQQLYSAFARQFRAPGQIVFQSFECERLQSLVTGKRPLSQNGASNLQSFLRLPIWSFHDTDRGCKVTWVQLALDFVSRYGFQPGWLSAEMSAGILASRFRSYFLKMLKANGIRITTVSRCRNLHVFGLPNQSGFYGSVCFDSFYHQMFFLCQANKFFATKTLLPNQKPRAHFKPDFTNFCTIPSYSPAAGVN